MNTCKGCGAELAPNKGRGRPRVWCSESCRKRTCYSGTCKGCGSRTTGCNGLAAAPDYCKECAPAAHMKWPEERVVAKIREWAERYGRPPGVMDWSPTNVRVHPDLSDALKERKIARFEDGDWPWANTVRERFGTFEAGLQAAGFEANPSGYHGRWEQAA